MYCDWSDDYSLHISTIDAQHQHLFSLVNTLHDAMRDGEGEKVAARVLYELSTYTHTHFRAEEEYMVRHGYPAYLAHKTAHDQFAATVRDYIVKFTRHRLAVTLDTLAMLKNWLTSHIKGNDQALGAFLKHRGVC